MPKGQEKRSAKEVREARAEYVVEPRIAAYPVYGTTRLSAKNQITLPVAYVRDMGLKPGDEITAWLEQGQIVLERKLEGKELLDSLEGSMKHGEWATKEGVDEWLRRERESWGRPWDEKNS